MQPNRQQLLPDRPQPALTDGRVDTGRVDTDRVDTGRVDTGRVDTGRVTRPGARSGGPARRADRGCRAAGDRWSG
ncbi:hypothetical protein FVP33_08095 [Lacisediminihabitans profunda]|uniref:Uncharacterized protein n=1 Tax=Lacisediminihabitans profunda TaxID=2594790 RepID=A0A5C8UU67_9MICO|nr:hypothetical protein FVP33_08095 [Lacisediminihabitans profunda]